MTAILQLIPGHLVNYESQRGFLAWLKSVGLKTRANFDERATRSLTLATL
jgi:hypothetical protein